MTTGELCRGPAWRVCHTCHNLSHVSAARVTARMPIVIGFVTRVTRVTPVTGGFGGRQVFVVWGSYKAHPPPACPTPPPPSHSRPAVPPPPPCCLPARRQRTRHRRNSLQRKTFESRMPLGEVPIKHGTTQREREIGCWGRSARAARGILAKFNKKPRAARIG